MELGADFVRKRRYPFIIKLTLPSQKTVSIKNNGQIVVKKWKILHFHLHIHCKLDITNQTLIWKSTRKDSAIREIRDYDHVGNREKLVTAFLRGRLNFEKSI